MKAASSEWYGTKTRLPVLHQASSTSSSLSRHQQWLSNGDSSSTSRYYASPSLGTVTSGYSFSTSTGSTNNNNSTTSTNSSTTTQQQSQYHPNPLHPFNNKGPRRQLSKVLTPTITSNSSTSFSKSYSRSSRSRSNSTDPTANSTSQYTTTTSEATQSSSRSGGSQPPFSFSSSDANKYKSSFSSQPSTSSNKGGSFPGSSSGGGGRSFSRGSSKLPSLSSFPPIISESEVSETEVSFTEEEEEEDEETGYDNTPQEPTDDQASGTEEEDPIYQSFKQSLRMLKVPSNPRRNSTFGSTSPAVSIGSVLTEVDEDEEDLPADSVDDEATSYTEEEEEEEDVSSFSIYRHHETHPFVRSTSVPKTPVKVRVKVERAMPQTYYDDRVKVTLQVEEETEASELDDDDDEVEGEEDEEEDEEENSVTESEATSASTAETVRYLNRTDGSEMDDRERTGGESYGESSEESGQSGSEMLSETEQEEETVVSSLDKTEYEPRRTPLFPPINSNANMFSGGNMSSGFGPLSMPSRKAPANMAIRNILQEWSAGSSTDTYTQKSSKKSETSVDSEGTGASCSEPTTSSSATTSSGATASSNNSEISSRSQSARNSLTGRASAIHKMYSVGGKVRSLSARRSLAQQQQSHSPNFGSAGTRQLSTDSASPSITSKISESGSSETSGSKHFLPDAHLGLSLPNVRPPSRSMSASSRTSRSPFSAALRQLSLGNIQAMNPPFPKSAAATLFERTLKGETLPPITPPSPSSSSSSLLLSPKPRPLLRNLTYTVCNHSTDSDSNNLLNPIPCQSTDQITLRQRMMRDRTSSESSSESQHSLNDVLFPPNLVKSQDKKDPPATKPTQVSFAKTVIEHSLSSSHTIESVSSERAGSAQNSDSSESSSEYINCRLTGRRMKRLTEEQEVELLNKDYLTFKELHQETIDGEPDTSKERLRHFALDTIRKQMEMERKRLESTEQEDAVFSDDYDFSEEEGSGSSEDSSEEEEEEEGSDKSTPLEVEGSHIPVAASGALPTAEASAEAGATSGDHVAISTEPGAAVPEKVGESLRVPNEINKSQESSASWKDEMKKVGEDGQPPAATEEDDDDQLSMLATRINSAESGYRAMPPSRAGSSREMSLDPEEMEREKERILQEWKDAGGTGAPPAINTSVNSTSSTMMLGGEIITINYSRPNSVDSKSNTLVKGGIDLTREWPGDEEKKIAAVWEEFNRDEREGGAMADYEFSSLLDEMIMDINSYKPSLSTKSLISNSNSSPSQSLQVSNTQPTSTSTGEQPKFDPSRKYSTLSELVSLLSHNLRLVSSETLEDHMASLISLISSVLRKVRKNKTEDDYITQISCLSAIRVLCDRLLEMTSSQNLKYADLSWLFRVLCKYSSDSDSKIRPEASFCLARLVKVAGPALVVRPIYFILVMEGESGAGKSTTGAKTKAAAIDTLTYAMLTFAKEDFHNLEEIAGWVCLAMLNEERRIRQSALECLAIISQHLGGRDKALPLFHQLFLKEELDHFSRSPSPESHKTSKTGKSSRKGKGSDPIPLSVHGTVRLLTGPGFPIAQPIDAITARLDKDTLPVPSTKGLIEYAVNVPTGKDLVLLMTHMLDKDDDEWDFSSSTDSLDSAASAHSKRSSVTSLGFSDIDWTGDGPEKDKNKDEDELISQDVAYILLGKGRVNKSDVVLLDTYKKEIIPEIIQLLNEKNKQGNGRRNRRKWANNQKKKKKRRRKGQPRRRRGDIPTLSFDAEDDTLQQDDEDGDEHLGDEVFNDPLSPVAVVVDPPTDNVSRSFGTEEETLKTDS